ncbi:hypothetical protein [Halomonas smyrnensis]|uniref:hypothetical protein n=1 Tax=Halomonas smyrnensis TaxID=720605 RepID=UPI0012EAE595|nr:hypothetical protein [Halomonas smyrnensis]
MNINHKYRRLHKYNHGGSDTVTKIEKGKTFHVIEGRNAWHSTWVVTYQANSFYSSLPAAKEYAESIRKSGSVFTVVERPCLIIRSQKKTTIVTELNHDTPLASHILGRDLESIPKHTIEDYRERSLFLPDFIKGFMHTSFGWDRKITEKNLLIMQHENPRIKINRLNEPLKATRSKSHGGDYFLSWHENNINTSNKPVSRLSENIAHLLSEDFTPKENIKSIDVENEKRLRLLKAKTSEFLGKKANLKEEDRNHLSDLFVEEIKEAYTDQAILSADENDILALSWEWTKSLSNFSPEDRKRILISEALKNSFMPFFRYR